MYGGGDCILHLAHFLSAEREMLLHSEVKEFKFFAERSTLKGFKFAAKSSRREKETEKKYKICRKHSSV